MIILVRHGQTAANAEGRLLGRLDPPLTELGRRQAMALAASVGRPARVITSPLGRARETAALLGLPARIPVTVDDRWIEIDYGSYDGCPLRDVPAELWARWRSDSNFRPPDGESLAAVGRRVRAACEELAEEATSSDVVVVSHVSPIKAAVAWALEVDEGVAWRMRLDVAAVCRLGVGPLGPSLLGFNGTGHLARVDAAPPAAPAPPEGPRSHGAAIAPGDPAAEAAAVFAAVGRERAGWTSVVDGVRNGTVDLDGALGRQELAGIKAVKIIEALPGVGKVKARRAMSKAGIGDRQRLGQLGPDQIDALRAALGHGEGAHGEDGPGEGSAAVT
ncbi:MAG TPA: histidine phosphatase family protein [Acidimicrobiales bacterium]